MVLASESNNMPSSSSLLLDRKYMSSDLFCLCWSFFVYQFQSSDALFEAVEHQELDLVQLLLSQYSLEELDLNTPNSEGLLPLDIAIMTNNVPMAKLLLRAGAKESPHCEYTNILLQLL